MVWLPLLNIVDLSAKEIRKFLKDVSIRHLANDKSHHLPRFKNERTFTL